MRECVEMEMKTGLKIRQSPRENGVENHAKDMRTLKLRFDITTKNSELATKFRNSCQITVAELQN